MADEDFYRIIAAELSSERIDPVLWTRALADADGDPDRTRAVYIRLRFQALKHPSGELDRIRRDLDAGLVHGNPRSLYHLLSVPPSASDAAIAGAIADYQARIDEGSVGASPEFAYAKEALGDPVAREAYDRRLHGTLPGSAFRAPGARAPARDHLRPEGSLLSWWDARKVGVLFGLVAVLSIAYLAKGLSRDTDEHELMQQRIAVEREALRAARDNAQRQAEIARIAIEKRDALMARAFGSADEHERNARSLEEQEAERRRQELEMRAALERQRLDMARELQDERIARSQQQDRLERERIEQEDAERMRRYWACMNAELDRVDSSIAYQRCAVYR